MARTRKRTPRSIYSRESTKVKRMTMRKWKAACRQAVREGRYDDTPLKRGTEGHVTW